MGHMGAKDIYRSLGRKLDHMQFRTPWNEALYNILKELYTTEEAGVIVRMPGGMSDFEQLERATGMEAGTLDRLLDSLCSKGLVMDVWLKDRYYYTPSPIVIGIFELTMMRTAGDPDYKKWAGLFHRYLDEEFLGANFGTGQSTTAMRSLPHEEAIRDRDHMAILDYESAETMVREANRFSIGICSCRHEKLHLGQKGCEVPLEKCSSFGTAADYLIRNGLARKASMSEMLENLAQSKEMGLVLNCDNVRRKIAFLCHCCKDCCMALGAISRHGYPNAILTSGFMAEPDRGKCTGCGKCARACPIEAIDMVTIEGHAKGKGKRPVIEKSICLGCGVCALKCEDGAMGLVRRQKRVIPPENTFERVILQCLDRNTLAHQIFDEPQRLSQKFLRGLLGGMLRLPPVKQALMSDMLRSRFLSMMKKGALKKGKGHLLEL